MTAPTLRLSDLAGPDVSGISDVAVFVEPDVIDVELNEPFVVVCNTGGLVVINYIDSQSVRDGKLTVRRLGRGRLEPARIVMEGEELGPTTMALAEAVIDSQKVLTAAYRKQVRMLREALAGLLSACDASPGPMATVDAVLKSESALAATGPTLSADERVRYLCKEWGPALQAMADSGATGPQPTEDAK